MLANSSGWPWRRKKEEQTGECRSYQMDQVGHGDGKRKKSSYQTAQVDHGDGQRKKSKTGEDGSYHKNKYSVDVCV